MRHELLGNSRESESSGPKRIGEILPDVLRRYGIVDTPRTSIPLAKFADEPAEPKLRATLRRLPAELLTKCGV